LTRKKELELLADENATMRLSMVESGAKCKALEEEVARNAEALKKVEAELELLKKVPLGKRSIGNADDEESPFAKKQKAQDQPLTPNSRSMAKYFMCAVAKPTTLKKSASEYDFTADD
jgi:hypothetical protein